MKYCDKCHAENNDDASYCIKCGSRFIKGDSKNKKKIGPLLIAALIVSLLCVGLAKYYPLFGGAGSEEVDHSISDSTPADAEIVPDAQIAANELTEDRETAENAQADASSSAVNIGEPENSVVETVAKAGSWHDSDQSYDVNINSVLLYGNEALCNFNDTVAVGVYGENGLISTTETESGFILSVIDNDSIVVSFYNNGTEDIKPVNLTAEMSYEDYTDDSGEALYIISGYSACPNGFGIIEMTLSNGYTVSAGILSDNGLLYAANLVAKHGKAETVADFRIKMDSILADCNIRPDNSIYTDPIYYPIVPMYAGEQTDVAFWVNKSNELVEDDWSDAHKVKVFYDYIIDNLAYDYWVLGQGEHGRIYLYQDFTGTYFTSKTNVGICEDFANILAIMCRTQGIPAVKVFVETHAWTYVYIEDYDRWMTVDATGDMRYGCYSEDASEWRDISSSARYTHLDYVTPTYAYCADLGACIGNEYDMERYGIIPVEQQEP